MIGRHFRKQRPQQRIFRHVSAVENPGQAQQGGIASRPLEERGLVERVGLGIGLTFFFGQVAFGHGMKTSLAALRKSQNVLKWFDGSAQRTRWKVESERRSCVRPREDTVVPSSSRSIFSAASGRR